MIKNYITLVFKGMVMGAADVVPGVSGGTMAFILGIYEELINSIKKFASINTIKLFLTFNTKKIINELPWRFLLFLGIGILISIVSLAKGIKYGLENHPAMIWAFFFGLVLASIITVRKKIEKWELKDIFASILGAAFAYLLVGLVPAQTPDTWWFIIISGSLAVSAMILPGISGAFILLLLGKYQTALSAVNDRNFMVIMFFAIGAIIGLATFIQLLNFLFKKYHNLTVAILIGFMMGSLRKIWPWKEALIGEFSPKEKIKQLSVQPNILPEINSQFFIACGLIIFGIVLVLILDNIASKRDGNKDLNEPV